MTEDERRVRYGLCICGRVRYSRQYTKYHDGRPYPYVEVYCASCRFEELVLALDLGDWWGEAA
jgi:hypothetical protein